jgi:hypothetical protein
VIFAALFVVLRFLIDAMTHGGNPFGALADFQSLAPETVKFG